MKRLAKVARGTLSLAIFALNILFWCSILFIFAAFKALVPLSGWRTWFTRRLHQIAENWIWVNNLNQSLLGGTIWNVQGMVPVNRSGWYLVLANHQSWVDIPVLQRIFNRKIPFMKFFIKKELFRFPVLGQAWWALDFPALSSATRPKANWNKKPHLKGSRTWRPPARPASVVKRLPTSIMNFAEGTRFSRAKHDLARLPRMPTCSNPRPAALPRFFK